MFRTAFPDLAFLRNMIATRQANGKGWPTCILNVTTQAEYRPEIRGPLSLFINLKGRSHCKVGRHEATIDTAHYFLSNSGDHYDLLIDTTTPTETFNIHIEERLMEQVYTGMTIAEHKLLDQPDLAATRPVNFFSQLHRRDAFVNALIKDILQQQALESAPQMRETEQMSALLVHLMGVHLDSLRERDRLPSVRPATREETYRRLLVARDLMHSCYDQELHLEDLAQVACMSRFHFLRAFKETFRCTPYQYLKNLRLEKAQWLLCKSALPITDIGLTLGYQNLSSFSRVFRQSLGIGPQKFRENRRAGKFAILVNR